MLSGSTFSGNTATAQGGGAAMLETAGRPSADSSGNTFIGNSVADPGGPEQRPRAGTSAGACRSQSAATQPTDGAVQRGNIFEGNSVSFKPAPVTATGGGEATTQVALPEHGRPFHRTTHCSRPSEAEKRATPTTSGDGARASRSSRAATLSEEPGDRSQRRLDADRRGRGCTTRCSSGPSANGSGIYVGFACSTSYTTSPGRRLDDHAQLWSPAPPGRWPGSAAGRMTSSAWRNTILAGDGGPELGGFNALAA